MKLSRIKNLIFLHLQRLPLKSRRLRPYIVKLGGVKILDYKSIFIGENVCFDTNHPSDIEIEKGVWITRGCILLTHYYNPFTHTFDRGKIVIRKNAFIGCNTVICKPVTIGVNSVIGAGSVVTKDITDNEIWAGNPAKFKKTISVSNNS